MTQKKIAKVEITYADGTKKRLTGEGNCQKWLDMVEAQASMAFVHGMSFGPLPWEETAAIKEGDEDPPCVCGERCKYNPCKGQCGCEACRLSYMDFLSCE